MNDELATYRDVCIQKGPAYYDYENYTPVWNPSEDIELGKSLGRGKYSEVFEG